MPLINFLKYNNAVPITIAIVMLGGGAAFAASDPSSIYSSSESVVSIDNTYLAQKDLSTYSPAIQILNVTEDEKDYFVSYQISTVDVDDAVWKDVVRDEIMQVSKPDLGPYRDLGVYVTEKMSNIVARELQRLKETQAAERAHVSQKVVATEYGGLIGKFLDTTTKQLPGYTPVVQPPSIASNENASRSLEAPATETTSPPAQSSEPASQTNAPVLKVLGNNPAEVPLGSAYGDLGAVITSMPNNYGVHVFFQGGEVQQVSLDTSSVGEYVITYKAWNEKGETGEATRIVRVFDPNAPVVAPEPAVEVAPAVSQEPAVEPVAEPVVESVQEPVVDPALPSTETPAE